MFGIILSYVVVVIEFSTEEKTTFVFYAMHSYRDFDKRFGD